MRSLQARAIMGRSGRFASNSKSAQPDLTDDESLRGSYSWALSEKAGAMPAFLIVLLSAAYTVARGFTRMTVAGTIPDAGAGVLLYIQSGSVPGVQAGSAGLSCCTSCNVDVFTK